jgi:Flp pilus assembly pilin Flp
LLKQLLVDERGQDLIEYGLLAALVGVVGVAIFPVIQGKLRGTYTGWGGAIQGLWIPKDPGTP